MNNVWIWKYPICKAKSKNTYHLSGKARRSGGGHLKNQYNDYETEPELIQVS